MRISVIIPVYNERAVIEQTARELSAYLESSFPEYELIFVSDGCTDDCAELLRSLELPGTRVLEYTPNRGKGCAVRTGMLAAAGELRIFTDSDLAYGPEVIGAITECFAAYPGTELVIGSRRLEKDGYAEYSPMRALASRTYAWVLRAFFGLRQSDSQCGCKGFTARAAEAIFPRCEADGFAFDFETLLWAYRLGLTIREIPVRILRHGDSKVRLLRDTLLMLRDLIRIKLRVRRSAI